MIINILRNFLIAILLTSRVIHQQVNTYFKDDVYPDMFISDSVSVLHFTYGHLTYFNTFMNVNFTVCEKKKFSWPSTRRNNLLVPLCFMLCGDIHPCPGPSTDEPTFNKSSDNVFKDFQKRSLHFLHIIYIFKYLN